MADPSVLSLPNIKSARNSDVPSDMKVYIDSLLRPGATPREKLLHNNRYYHHIVEKGADRANNAKISETISRYKSSEGFKNKVLTSPRLRQQSPHISIFDSVSSIEQVMTPREDN